MNSSDEQAELFEHFKDSIAREPAKTFSDSLRPTDDVNGDKEVQRDRMRRKMTRTYQLYYTMWRDFSLLTAFLAILGLIFTGSH
jgi:hypothetical protein